MPSIIITPSLSIVQKSMREKPRRVYLYPYLFTYFHGETELRRLLGTGPRSLRTRASTPGILCPDLGFLFTNPAFLVKDVWTDPPRGVGTVTCSGLRDRAKSREGTQSKFTLKHTRQEKSRTRDTELPLDKLRMTDLSSFPSEQEMHRRTVRRRRLLRKGWWRRGNAFSAGSRRPEAGKDVQQVGREGAPFRAAGAGRPGNAGTKSAGPG